MTYRPVTGPGAAAGAGSGVREPLTFGDKDKLNAKDFLVSGRHHERVLRLPGSINGQQFIVEECDDCDVWLLDWSATIQIDFCTNCRFFVGPVESSLFLRNCKDCQVVAACQQFRTRDCENIQLSLYSLTQPSIETSKNLQFSCFQFYYAELSEQFRKAKLEPFKNQWSRIHDFNHDPDSWCLLPLGVGTNELIKSPPSWDGSEFTQASVVPLTHGCRRPPGDEVCLLVIYTRHRGLVSSFVNFFLSLGHKCACLQILSHTTTAGEIGLLFAATAEPPEWTDEIIALNMCGPNCNQEVNNAVQRFSETLGKHAADIFYVSPSADLGARQVSALFANESNGPGFGEPPLASRPTPAQANAASRYAVGAPAPTPAVSPVTASQAPAAVSAGPGTVAVAAGPATGSVAAAPAAPAPAAAPVTKTAPVSASSSSSLSPAAASAAAKAMLSLPRTGAASSAAASSFAAVSNSSPIVAAAAAAAVAAAVASDGFKQDDDDSDNNSNGGAAASQKKQQQPALCGDGGDDSGSDIDIAHIDEVMLDETSSEDDDATLALVLAAAAAKKKKKKNHQQQQQQQQPQQQMQQQQQQQQQANARTSTKGDKYMVTRTTDADDEQTDGDLGGLDPELDDEFDIIV